MSRNPQKDYLKARIFIDKQISNISVEGTRINSIIRSSVLTYPISEQMIRNFIKKFYIDEGLVELRDEVLYVKAKVT